MAKYLDSTGLTHFWAKIKTWVGNYVKITSSTGKDTITAGNNSVDVYDWAQASEKPGYNLDEISDGTTNKAFTQTEKTKLGNIAPGAEVNQNAFGKVKVGTTTIEADAKIDTLEIDGGGDVTVTADASGDKVTVSVTTPKKTSELTNDSGFITSADIPEGAAASTTSPKMDGTASVGTEMAFARGDHRHPSDTTKQDVIDASHKLSADLVEDGTANKAYTAAEKNKLATVAENAEANQNAFSNIKVGTTTVAADAKTDTVELVAGSNITLTPDATNDKITIAAAGVTPASASPLVNGTAAVGTSAKYAREDHVHPTDTSRAADNAVVHLTGDETIAGNKTFSNMVRFNGGSLDTNISLSDGEAEMQFWGQDDKGFSWIRESVTSDGGKVTQWRDLGTVLNGKVNTSVVGSANGVCPLNAGAKIDAQYLPAYVDDVVEAYIRSGQTALSQSWLATGSASGTVITPESGVIYVLMNGNDTYPTNSQYRWGGTAYVKLNDGGVSAITNAEIDSITAN